MPKENSQQFAKRVLEQGTKLGKSDRDLLTQFIRGLPTPNRIHTIAQDTDTFNGATRIATLFETAQTFGQDDGTVTLQQQGTSVKEQNFNIIDSRIQCAYCRKDGHHISECHHRQYNTEDNTPTVHSGTEHSTAHHRKDRLTDELTNSGLCTMIFCVSIVMAQVTLPVIVIWAKYKNLICRALIIIHPISRNRATRSDKKIITNPVNINKIGRMFIRAIDNQLSKKGTFPIPTVTDAGKLTRIVI